MIVLDRPVEDSVSVVAALIVPMKDTNGEMERLHAENARLIALLGTHGIDWRLPEPARVQPQEKAPQTLHLTPEEKIALFRRLFHGRDDVYAVRWENKAGKSGYAPACRNDKFAWIANLHGEAARRARAMDGPSEWKPGVCEKPRVKCQDCGHRQLEPLCDSVIYDHLAGRRTIGIYPLRTDETCHFLAVDFDEAEWRDDVRAFARSCRELDVPVAVEISRSGNGAHAWLFFDTAVPARDARRLGTAILSHTCARIRQLKLSSYDRLFPNQDVMPKGGFGNLIALPLQKGPREQGYSVFVDDDLKPYADPWAFLASLPRIGWNAIESIILRATAGAHPLDVTFVSDEDDRKPWERPAAASTQLPEPLPQSLTVTLANQIYFQKDQLTQPLTNRLIRLAAFQNPEFYRAQAMRLPVWNKPRVIGCAENHPHHVALPRGCRDAVEHLLRENGIRCDWIDERYAGAPLRVAFKGTLRTDQDAAVAGMLRHDTGILCAPTAFGKTVTAIALIAQRGVNTLILVHRTELLKQWRERLLAYLDVGNNAVGAMGGGKHQPTGQIDIAVMQSLSRRGEISDVVENYGHIIVDECHHLSAFSFESILKRAKAKPD